MPNPALPNSPSEVAFPPRLPIVRHAPMTLGVTVLLLGLSDWLFFNPFGFGVSVALFSLAVASGAYLVQRDRASRQNTLLGVGIAVAGALPAAVESSLLTFPVAVIGAGLAAFAFGGGLQKCWQNVLLRAGRLLALGPFQVIADVFRIPRAFHADTARALICKLGLTWAIPLGLGLIFLVLFAQANPLIGTFVLQWENAVLGLFNPLRIIFWGIVLSVIWPMINLRLKATAQAKSLSLGTQGATLADYLMSDAAILRALILFNALFAAQTAMDAAYLTNGLALPNGVTYARYAHSGAYPLIGTALLAAAFVLVTLRKGGTAEQSPMLRRLLYVFVAQNIALVVSSIYRLKLYVDAYSMTYWRLAAFVWMALVLLGLALIIVRIADRRDNDWLIGRNLMALGVALYASCFVNTANLVGNYNIEHPQTASRHVDAHYLISLGASALSSTDRLIELINKGERSIGWPLSDLVCKRDIIAKVHLARQQNWRAWTARDAQIKRYIESRPLTFTDRSSCHY